MPREDSSAGADRLFVPLKTEHYTNFQSGDKEWELRGINDQFNEDTVYEGRRVELRRGYNTDDSLWGEVTEVETFGMLTQIPIEIDHTLIVPGATHTEFLDGAAELLGQYDRYIAFRVEVDDEHRLAPDGGLPLEDDRRGAMLSDGREYRYRLWREWDVDKPTVAFIMLNPSTANEWSDDNTIRRCIGYARDWGYGKLVVGNLFALRTKDPSDLREHDAPIGPENDDHLRSIVEDADRVVAAWGEHGTLQKRGDEVARLLDAEDVDVVALDTTLDGQPVHPLYKPADIDPVPFPGGESDGE